MDSSSERPPRSLLLALELSNSSDRVFKFVVDNVASDGDVVNIVHVLKCLPAPVEVYHGVPGTTYNVSDTSNSEEARAIEALKAAIKLRFTDELDAKGVAHNLHLFVDTVNAPASAIGGCICKAADGCNADLIAVATSNKSVWDKVVVGSVAEWCTNQITRPLLLVP